MPITSSAKKAARQAIKRETANKAVKKDMRTVVRSLEKAIETGKKDEATNLISLAYKKLDKAAQKGIIEKRTASRKKSRLFKLVKGLGKPQTQG